MADDPGSPRIVVAGAGAIGCFVGGQLAHAGRDVTLLVRPRIAAELLAQGLSLTDLDGGSCKVAAEALSLSEDPACLGQADVILVTVKSRDTAEMADLIGAQVAAGATVVSLQNGLSNAALLRDRLGTCDVRAGMVPFNVVPTEKGGYHRATDGHIIMEDGPNDLANLLSVPGLPVEASADIENVQWGKLLLNLTNALNALSGLPIRAQLTDRRWRLLMAAQWEEALKVMTALGAKPVSSAPVSVHVIPWVLRLPTLLFTRVASAMLNVDPSARASMSYDLMAGRPTEIDVLQGEILRRAKQAGLTAPINAAIAKLIQEAEAAQSGLPNLSPSDIRRKLG